MVNVNLLKSEIVKRGWTQDEFCARIGMAHSTFVRKMKKGIVTTKEAETMTDVLGVKNPEKIFFAKN